MKLAKKREALREVGKQAARLLDEGLDVAQAAVRLKTTTQRIYKALILANEYSPRLRARLARFGATRVPNYTASDIGEDAERDSLLD